MAAREAARLLCGAPGDPFQLLTPEPDVFHDFFSVTLPAGGETRERGTERGLQWLNSVGSHAVQGSVCLKEIVNCGQTLWCGTILDVVRLRVEFVTRGLGDFLSVLSLVL